MLGMIGREEWDEFICRGDGGAVVRMLVVVVLMVVLLILLLIILSTDNTPLSHQHWCILALIPIPPSAPNITIFEGMVTS